MGKTDRIEEGENGEEKTPVASSHLSLAENHSSRSLLLPNGSGTTRGHVLLSGIGMDDAPIWAINEAEPPTL